MTIPSKGRVKGVISFVPLEVGTLSINGISLKSGNLNEEIYVDHKGFPNEVIDEINIYKYEKLGIHLRKIEVKC